MKDLGWLIDRDWRHALGTWLTLGLALGLPENNYLLGASGASDN